MRYPRGERFLTDSMIGNGGIHHLLDKSWVGLGNNYAISKSESRLWSLDFASE